MSGVLLRAGSPDCIIQPHHLLTGCVQGLAACLLPATHSRFLSRLQVSVLGCPDPVVHEIAYQYGKNVGIAFQVGLLPFKNVTCWHSGKGLGDTSMAVLLTYLFSVC